MASVFLLRSGRYSDIQVEGVFTTREKAEVALKELEKIKPGKAGPVEEVELDLLAQSYAKSYWKSTIDVMTGAISDNPESNFYRCDRGERHEWNHEGEWMDADNFLPHVEDYPYRSGYIPNHLEVYSSVSQEHADKLAVEARQYLMHKIDFSLIVNDRGLHYPEHLSMILNGEVNPFKD